MISILWSLIAFIIVLGILVSVHEFGHFWAARRCGVKVERFSIGFGKVLYRRYDKLGTEYAISLIPLGGYVKMLDGSIEPIPVAQHQFSYHHKKIWQRATIIAAGPVANFIFALLVYWVIYMIGIPSVKPIIGDIKVGSIAAQSHLMPNEEIKTVNGSVVSDWSAVRLALLAAIGKDHVELGVINDRSSGIIEKKLDLTGWFFSDNEQDPLIGLGIYPVYPKVKLTLSFIEANSPAEKAGFKVRDKIVAVDDKVINNWDDFVREIRNNPNKLMQIQVERDRQHLLLTLIPQLKKSANGQLTGYVGVLPEIEPLADNYKILQQYGPYDAIIHASASTWQLMVFTTEMLYKLVIGDVKLNSLSGPISIAKGAGISAEYGLVSFLIFLALLSVNLGVINLVPLPILDGGRLLFLLIEKIKGTPLSEQVQEYSMRIGVMVLMLLMGFALFNDFSRL